jgi:hypothetical protein
MIYYLHAPNINAVKIGYTKHAPLLRWRTHAAAVPFAVDCLGWHIGDREDEADIHKMFAGLHVKNEWFKDTEAVLSYARNACPNFGEDHQEAQWGGDYRRYVRIHDLGQQLSDLFGINWMVLNKWTIQEAVLGNEEVAAIRQFVDEHKLTPANQKQDA